MDIQEQFRQYATAQKRAIKKQRDQTLEELDAEFIKAMKIPKLQKRTGAFRKASDAYSQCWRDAAEQIAILEHSRAVLLAFLAESESLPKYTEAAQQFHDKRPTHIGTIGDVSFYEDPEQGDEEPLWAIFINKAGMFDAVHTDFWDRPYLEEALDWLEEQLQ